VAVAVVVAAAAAAAAECWECSQDTSAAGRAQQECSSRCSVLRQRHASVQLVDHGTGTAEVVLATSPADKAVLPLAEISCQADMMRACQLHAGHNTNAITHITADLLVSIVEYFYL